MTQNNKKGFAMLFTVLIVSIILSLALGIADVTYKQTILSGLAKNSQLAFYQADAGVECGMYYDLHQGQFPRGSNITDVPSTLTCGNTTVALDSGNSMTDYFIYTTNAPSKNPCYSVLFDKSTDPVKDVISSRGYSTCSTTAQQVERGLKVTY